MSDNSDEIDIRPYIHALIRHWKRIALLVVVLSGVAIAITLLLPRSYEATATILLTRTRSQLSLTEQFVTIPEVLQYDTRSRLQALVTIAQSDAIALAALQDLGSKLPEDKQKLETLKDNVEIKQVGDTILITAKAEEPGLAADIANNWASQAVETINLAYSGEKPMSIIQAQLEMARSEYAVAQAALEAFIQGNQITTLNRRILEKQKIVEMLQERQLGVIGLNLGTQLGMVYGQADDYFNTLLNQRSVVFKKQWNSKDQLLSFYYDRYENMEELIIRAEALKQQLIKENFSTPGNLGDALAILLARASTFGLGGDLTLRPEITDLSILLDESGNYVTDLDTLIQGAKNEKDKMEQKINELSKELLTGEGYQFLEAQPALSDPLFQAALGRMNALLDLELPTSLVPDYQDRPLFNMIETTAKQVRELNKQLEQEEAHQKELTYQRDIAREAYEILESKVTELESSPPSSYQVNLASVAIPPEEPAKRGTLRNTMIAGGLGLVLGLFWVFGELWWRSLNLNKLTAAS